MTMREMRWVRMRMMTAPCLMMTKTTIEDHRRHRSEAAKWRVGQRTTSLFDYCQGTPTLIAPGCR